MSFATHLNLPSVEIREQSFLQHAPGSEESFSSMFAFDFSWKAYRARSDRNVDVGMGVPSSSTSHAGMRWKLMVNILCDIHACGCALSLGFVSRLHQQFRFHLGYVLWGARDIPSTIRIFGIFALTRSIRTNFVVIRAQGDRLVTSIDFVLQILLFHQNLVFCSISEKECSGVGMNDLYALESELTCLDGIYRHKSTKSGIFYSTNGLEGHSPKYVNALDVLNI